MGSSAARSAALERACAQSHSSWPPPSCGLAAWRDPERPLHVSLASAGAFWPKNEEASLHAQAPNTLDLALWEADDRAPPGLLGELTADGAGGGSHRVDVDVVS
jgi:hypothetical protein